MLLVGLYEIWYGWYEIRILRGSNASDPLIGLAISIQSQVSQRIASLGTPLLIAIVVTLSLTLMLTGKRKRKKILGVKEEEVL